LEAHKDYKEELLPLEAHRGSENGFKSGAPSTERNTRGRLWTVDD